jgi:hypothetical protein
VKETSKAGAAVICDGPGCRQRFATVSDGSVVRDQAATKGWSHVSGKSIRDNNGTALSSKKVDLCPSCKPEVRKYG